MEFCHDCIPGLLHALLTPSPDLSLTGATVLQFSTWLMLAVHRTRLRWLRLVFWCQVLKPCFFYLFLGSIFTRNGRFWVSETTLYINRSFIKNKHKCYIAINIYFRGSKPKSHGMEIKKNVEKLTYLIRGSVEEIYKQSIKLSWNRVLVKNMAGKQILAFRAFNEWHNVTYWTVS